MSEQTAPYRKHYDEDQARGYERAKAADVRSHRAECRLVERALEGVPRGESIVDAPCGAGRMTVLLAGLGFRPAAADVSPAMVDLARQRFLREGLQVAVEQKDLEATGWPDGAFDNVFSFRFFHHLATDAQRRTVARELCRVAARRVIVSYLDARSWTCRKRALEARLSGRRPGKHPLAPHAMAGFFEEAGFRPVADHARFPLVHSLRVLVAERILESRSTTTFAS
ncbi:MAG TPA: class I SAM-dependent methyltransferase [Planctomycetota bacterium]|nr:class I SAM-dependent methyltransferase [Planctomycetota bacterium]